VPHLSKGAIIEKIKQDALDTIDASQEVNRPNSKTLLGAFTDAILHLLSPLL